MKKFILVVWCCLAVITASAQIGYQVALLNNATGEPRVNESVSITVKITDSNGNVICEETKNEVTNDFGVVSVSVGDSDTFTNADWSNLPFFIEASVDDRPIGRSQILSVPIAEHAKHTGTLTKEILCSKTWASVRIFDMFGYKDIVTFNNDGSGRSTYGYVDQNGQNYSITDDFSGHYVIQGNIVTLIYNDSYGKGSGCSLIYVPSENCLVGTNGVVFK